MAKFIVPYLLALSIPSLLGSAQAESLYVSHYSGSIYLLSLNSTGNGSYTLSNTASIVGCGVMPSWLTYDSTNKMLYCSDEAFYGTGSISAFSVGSDGRLTQSAKASAIYGAVANVLYGGSDGKGYIAIAHYQASAVSTFKLPLTSSSTALQSFTFTMAQKGPNPSRQDAPHPHEVVVDPTGQYLLAPDLGADMIRIWSINQSTGILTSCPSFNVTPGTGPRHAAFWTPPTSSRIRRATTGTMMYVANELANTVRVFSASYPSGGCITFTETQNMSPFPNNATAPTGTKVAEVHLKDNFLYSANRADKSFSGNDSMVSWSLDSTGAITMQGFTDSYGTYPRTFSISPSGEFIAIGDQTTSNIAIVKRDATTGLIGDLVASLRVATVGHAEQEDGLSSVVWAD